MKRKKPCIRCCVIVGAIVDLLARGRDYRWWWHCFLLVLVKGSGAGVCDRGRSDRVGDTRKNIYIYIYIYLYIYIHKQFKAMMN